MDKVWMVWGKDDNKGREILLYVCGNEAYAEKQKQLFEACEVGRSAPSTYFVEERNVRHG